MIVGEGHPDFDIDAAADDRAYLDTISTTLMSVMRSQKDSNYFIVVIEENSSSKVMALPYEDGLASLREELRRDPHPLFQQVIDRLSQKPSHHMAKWVVMCRADKSFRLCSIMNLDVSNTTGIV